MLKYLKSEWLRLILIAMYIIVVVHCATVGNVLAMIGWGTGAVILVVGSIASHCFYVAKAKRVNEAKNTNTVIIEINDD